MESYFSLTEKVKEDDPMTLQFHSEVYAKNKDKYSNKCMCTHVHSNSHEVEAIQMSIDV